MRPFNIEPNFLVCSYDTNQVFLQFFPVEFVLFYEKRIWFQWETLLHIQQILFKDIYTLNNKILTSNYFNYLNRKCSRCIWKHFVTLKSLENSIKVVGFRKNATFYNSLNRGITLETNTTLCFCINTEFEKTVSVTLDLSLHILILQMYLLFIMKFQAWIFVLKYFHHKCEMS